LPQTEVPGYLVRDIGIPRLSRTRCGGGRGTGPVPARWSGRRARIL